MRGRIMTAWSELGAYRCVVLVLTEVGEDETDLVYVAQVRFDDGLGTSGHVKLAPHQTGLDYDVLVWIERLGVVRASQLDETIGQVDLDISDWVRRLSLIGDAGLGGAGTRLGSGDRDNERWESRKKDTQLFAKIAKVIRMSVEL